jgi:hypothetical protein
VAALLRRLGSPACGAGGEPAPADGATDVEDDRLQQQRPG